MTDSRRAYMEALKLTRKSRQGDLHAYIDHAIIDRITDNYYRIRFMCNIPCNAELKELLIRRMNEENEDGCG